MYCAVGIIKENLDDLQCSAATVPVPLMNVHLYYLRPSIDIIILHVDHASIIWTSAVRFYFLISSEFQRDMYVKLGIIWKFTRWECNRTTRKWGLNLFASIVVRSFRFSISCRIDESSWYDIIVMVVVRMKVQGAAVLPNQLFPQVNRMRWTYSFSSGEMTISRWREGDWLVAFITIPYSPTCHCQEPRTTRPD